MTETPEQPPAEQEDSEHGEQILTEWKFRGRPPTEEQVRALLATLPPVHGIQHSNYFDFVQALPAREKVYTQNPDPTKTALVEEYLDVWTIYMSVAGRQAMLNAAQQLNDWRVDMLPEPTVQPPGYLDFTDKLVYRVAIKIWQPMRDGEEIYLGVRHGTAWVPPPGEKRKQAAASNPYEKVETSALGRALGAWGFGVFPGSGIASVEEMQQIRENREYLQALQTGQAPPARRSREEMLQEVVAVNERLRQALGWDQEQADRAVGKFVTDRLHVAKAFDAATGIIDWDALRDGHLDLLLNALREQLRKHLADTNPLGG